MNRASVLLRVRKGAVGAGKGNDNGKENDNGY